MPGWAQIILTAAALVTAVHVIWTRLLKPLVVVRDEMKESVPVMREAVVAMKDAPGTFLVLQEIASQFRTDSGSSLRDVVNRLETALQVLKVADEAARVLSVQDRAKLQAIIDAAAIAAGLASGVADDLDAAHERAEAEPVESEPGAAADSAMRRPEDD